MAEKRTGFLTFQGNPLTLVGTEVKAGQKAPEFTLADKDFHTVRLADTPAKARVFSVVPSLDTGVCDLQSRRFEKEAQRLGDKVQFYTVSMDTPFAQQRWCGAAEAQRLVMLSDIRDQSFGKAFGVRIEELGLLARAVFVVDKDGTVRHAEIVPEVTDHPDYDKALKAVEGLLG